MTTIPTYKGWTITIHRDATHFWIEARHEQLHNTILSSNKYAHRNEALQNIVEKGWHLNAFRESFLDAMLNAAKILEQQKG